MSHWAYVILLVCVTVLGQGHARSTFNVSDSKAAGWNDIVAPIASNSFLPNILKICAFNIKTFGRAKMGDAFTAGIIRDIVKRYDLILIQEIRDISGEAIQQLWDMVGRNEYSLVQSGRLGRSSYKEQYAFFYRFFTVQVIDEYQYDDGPDDYTDPFEREPYIVKIKPVGGSWNFAVAGIHVKPDAAVSEISELYTVYQAILKRWTDVQDVIIMGDLNAACSYAKESDLLGMPIYNQNNFIWPLGFDADTTTSQNTDCAYDRFVITGPNLKSAYIPGSEGIYQYEITHKLSYDQMLDVSDHYPVEIEIY